MTIDEVKERAEQLRRELTLVVGTFEEDTGMYVQSIDITRLESIGDTLPPIITPSIGLARRW